MTLVFMCPGSVKRLVLAGTALLPFLHRGGLVLLVQPLAGPFPISTPARMWRLGL